MPSRWPSRPNVGMSNIISNIGLRLVKMSTRSVLTRRLDPLDRVKELGDASVPFAFDVHAMIPSEDAPAAPRRSCIGDSFTPVNKVNRRKEFFRLKLQDIRNVVDGLTPGVRWTLAAEARDYRDSPRWNFNCRRIPNSGKRWTGSGDGLRVTPTFRRGRGRAAERR